MSSPTKKPAARKPRAAAPRKPRPVPPKPFTPEHFVKWAYQLKLDNGKRWKVEPFQLAYVTDVFARTSGGRALYFECWDVVPEENGKTTLLAGLAVYGAEFADRAAIPVAASSREQAEVLYSQGEGLVQRNPRLKTIFACQPGYRRILNKLDGGRVQVFASDDRTGDGIIPFPYAITDELHRHPRGLSLYRTWRGKLNKRGAQILAISTAGEPGSDFELTREQIRQRATEVTSTHDGAFTRYVSGGVVLHEWAVAEEGDIEDMHAVKQANPFSGITIKYLTEKRVSPTMTAEHWSRFVCNRATRGGKAAISEVEWRGAFFHGALPTEQDERPPAWLGLDPGWKWDTFAMTPMWAPTSELRLLGIPEILVPPRDTGISLDPLEVKRAYERLEETWAIHTVVMDMTRAEDIASWLEHEKGVRVVDHAQGTAVQGVDYEKFLEALRSGWLKHLGDPTLTQHVYNAVTTLLPGGGAKFDRKTKSREGGAQELIVIDGLVAAAMVNAVVDAEFGVPPPQILVAYG